MERWVVVALVAGALMGAAREAAPAGADGTILSIGPYRYPEGELTETQARNLANYYTPAEYQKRMAEVRASDHELLDVWYWSDGLRVRAYVYKPKAPPAPLPAIVYARGSGPMDDQGFVFAPFFHRLAEAGFVVVAPQYRGGAGGEGVDELGGADVADVASAVALCGKLGYVDAAKLFLYGESRGGMMAFQAIRDGLPVLAAATFGAFTDLEETLAAMPWERPERIWPDWHRDRDAIAARRSAVRWAERLDVPLLLMHGGADPQISPAQTLRLALRLQELGRPYELVVYAGDGHILKQHQIERDALATAWFRRHLPGRGDPGSSGNVEPHAGGVQ